MKKNLFLGLCMFFSVFSLTAQPGNGLIGKYTFDNGNADNEADTVGHGTVVGATLTRDRFGNADKAYRFSPVTYIQIPSATYTQAEMTVSLWFKIEANTASPTGSNAIFAITNDDAGANYCDFCMTYFASTMVSEPSLTATAGSKAVGSATVNEATARAAARWRHYVVTITTDSLISYVNGRRLAVGKPFANDFSGTYANLHIGALLRNNAVQGGITGAVDDIFIYNRKLTEQEVMELYNMESPVSKPINYIVPNGLVAKYYFNGVVEDEKYANNPINFNASTVADRFGNAAYALNFNGSLSGLVIPHAHQIALENMNEGYSISSWVYVANPTPGLSSVVTKWQGGATEEYGLFLSTNISGASPFTAVRTTNPNGIAAGTSYTNPAWYHVVSTFDRTSLQHKIYVNKIEILNQTTSVSLDVSDSPLHSFTDLSIGCQLNSVNTHNPVTNLSGANRYFNGSIDDVRIYNRVLAQNEVDSLFDEPNPVLVSTLNEIPGPSSFAVFPNPSTNGMFFWQSTQDDLEMIEVMDLSGRLLLQQSLRGKNGVLELSLPSGLYLLRSRLASGKVEVNKIQIIQQ